MARSKNQWTLTPKNCGTGSDSLALLGNDPNSVPGDSFLDCLTFPVDQVNLARRKPALVCPSTQAVACLTQIGHRFLISSGSLSIRENLSSSMALRTATLSVVSIDSYSFRSASDRCP